MHLPIFRPHSKVVFSVAFHTGKLSPLWDGGPRRLEGTQRDRFNLESLNTLE